MENLQQRIAKKGVCGYAKQSLEEEPLMRPRQIEELQPLVTKHCSRRR